MATTQYDEDKDVPVYGPAVLPVAVAAGANPTKAEYDALVGKFNTLVTALTNANILAAD